AYGALALLILLDQYPRNAFRGTAHMFATDPLARLYAQRMVDAGLDALIEPELRAFCYLPFEHSEDPRDQQRSIALNQHLDASTYHWAKEHARIIQRFGRFPHRNAVLGRETTDEEQCDPWHWYAAALAHDTMPQLMEDNAEEKQCRPQRSHEHISLRA
ncbi:MAG: DUF924 domain-containing protein, partial [Verrucomicrobiaceae bacterium]